MLTIRTFDRARLVAKAGEGDRKAGAEVMVAAPNVKQRDFPLITDG